MPRLTCYKCKSYYYETIFSNFTTFDTGSDGGLIIFPKISEYAAFFSFFTYQLISQKQQVFENTEFIKLTPLKLVFFSNVSNSPF